MKFSIITVTYNSEKFLEQTIQSVLSQTYRNIEYIVIDGASTDNTLNIINKYRDKIAYLISEPDKNMYDAINKGLKLASGEYIAILNSDDYYVDNNVIQNVANHIVNLKDNKWGGVYGNLIKVRANNSKIRNRRGFQISFKELLLSNQMFVVGHSSLFLNRKCIRSIGYYDSEHLSYAADADYIFRCFKQYKFKYINLDIFNFRVHPDSITALGNSAKEGDYILKKNGYYNYSPLLRNSIYYYIRTKFVIYNFFNLFNKLFS